MTANPSPPAAIQQPNPQALALSGAWTALALGDIGAQLAAMTVPARTRVVADGAGIVALDTAGAWVMHKLLSRLRAQGADVVLGGMPADFAKLLDVVAGHADGAQPLPAAAPRSVLERVGRATESALKQGIELLAFIGETAMALVGSLAHPARLRWRPILFNIRIAGFDALPIVGLLSFLLGIVVAYQGAAQLRQYGANIFVADLVGLSMLREFAPLITAIIIAGRSGSAYAAQIGTMSVTEEIDAMRTLGIAPQEMLVLPKIIALAVALPLLTVFADVLGVLGGMLMARTQLGVGFGDFLERFVKAVSTTSYLIGICKAPVFAVIIAVVGCFQGFRTQGGADSVGRQTTRSVVQAIFLVIVADALFSVAFSALDL
jgi:phospholipid/cholesterol/gamma-HCH transport system permease protein